MGTRRVGAPVAIQDPVTKEEIVVVASDRNELAAFRAGGTPLWRVTLDGPALGSPAVASGQIYVATKHSVYAIR